MRVRENAFLNVGWKLVVEAKFVFGWKRETSFCEMVFEVCLKLNHRTFCFKYDETIVINCIVNSEWGYNHVVVKDGMSVYLLSTFMIFTKE